MSWTNLIVIAITLLMFPLLYKDIRKGRVSTLDNLVCLFLLICLVKFNYYIIGVIGVYLIGEFLFIKNKENLFPFGLIDLTFGLFIIVLMLANTLYLSMTSMRSYIVFIILNALSLIISYSIFEIKFGKLMKVSEAPFLAFLSPFIIINSIYFLFKF